MSAIDIILCPVDFSETSEAALRYACELAQQVDAKVHVLHVYQIPVYPMPDGALMPTANWTTHIIDSAQHGLGELLEKHEQCIDHHDITEGVPHQEINRVAEASGADLIVMGTHGRAGLSHMFMGSVAERVVRTAKVPVLTVRTP